MLRRTLTVLALLGLCVGVPYAFADDCKGCQAFAKTGDGFCDKCNHGKVFGMDVASKEVYTALSGTPLDAAQVKCDGCKAAIDANGICKKCNVGVAFGKAYKSMFAYKLAKGLPSSAEKAAHCPTCKTAFKDNGFCTGCNMGFVAGRGFTDKNDYEGAKNALATITTALETSKKCGGCATAMVTDGTCAKCKVTFKDGKKTG